LNLLLKPVNRALPRRQAEIPIDLTAAAIANVSHVAFLSVGLACHAAADVLGTTYAEISEPCSSTVAVC
jgi:hypothetical protein